MSPVRAPRLAHRLPPLAALLLVAGAGHRASAEPAWRPSFERDGLAVFTRPVPGSPIDEVRAVQVVDLPASVLFATLGDIEAYPREMPPTVVARRLRSEGESTWWYMEIANSVVSRRYYCSKVTLRRLPTGVLRSEWTLAADEACPAKVPGKVQMAVNTGSWTLTPLGDGRTEVIFQSHADPGGSIPAWMVNRVTGRTMPETFANLKKAALRRSSVAHK